MKRNPSAGQALVELALTLPLLLLLLAGSYACCRAAFLHAAAESAAHTEALRAGRRLPGIEKQMCDAILPEGSGVDIRTDRVGKTGILPAPFPSLEGRTRGIVELVEGSEGTVVPQFPPLRFVRIAEGSVECWENRSPSGKKVRHFVGGFVATGMLR